MIVLSLDLDSGGRPVVGLFAATSAPRASATMAVGETVPRPVEVRALVDTGAVRTIVQRSIVRALGLDPVGVETLSTASGGPPRECNAYSMTLFLAGVEGGLLESALRVVEVDDLGGLGVEMLLGRDVLDRCLLNYNGPEGRYSLAW